VCSKPKTPPTPAAPVTQLDADLADAVSSGGKEQVKKRKGDRNALRIDAPSGGSANGLNIPQ
jgi:hypothetical protein